MKKLLLMTAMCVIFITALSFAGSEITLTTIMPRQAWTVSDDGSSIYTTDSTDAGIDWNVGIGTSNPNPNANPNVKLEVEGGVGVEGNLFFEENTDSVISFDYPDNIYDRRLRITAGKTDSYDNTEGASIDLHGNNHNPNAGRLDLVAGGNSSITFWTGTGPNRRMTVNNVGGVGIGTTSPKTALDVNGLIRTARYSLSTDLGGALPNPSANNKGAIFYNTDDDTMYFSNGSSWQPMGGGGGGGVAFGGIYVLSTSGSCITPNPVTGACSAPSGFSTYTLDMIAKQGAAFVPVKVVYCIK